MATSMSDFAKASDLFGINKFEKIEEYFIVTCDFIGLPCLMHKHENEILLVKFPTVCMECNGIKYCGCRRWVTVRLKAFALVQIFNFSSTSHFTNSKECGYLTLFIIVKSTTISDFNVC